MLTRDTESLDRCPSVSFHLFKPFENYYILKFVTWLKALSTAVRRDGAVKIFSQSLLFNLRCKSQNEFLSNFSSSTEIIPCKICQKHQDTQEHALFCEKLKLYMTIENRQFLEDVKYSDLISNVNDQLLITDVFQAIIDTREKICDTARESQPGPSSGPHDL